MPPRDKATSSVSSCIGTFFVGMKVVPFCFILGNGVGDTKSPVKIKKIKKIKIYAINFRCWVLLFDKIRRQPNKKVFNNFLFCHSKPILTLIAIRLCSVSVSKLV